MAPSTRLRTQPERRVDYSPGMPVLRAGTARIPIVLEDTPSPQDADPKTETAAAKPARDASGRKTTSNNSAKQKPARKKVVKVAAPSTPKKPARPEKTECLICATTKNTRRSFKTSSMEGLCEHFGSICDVCVQKQLKTKLAARQLTDAHLPCMFPDCATVLDYTAVKKVASKALFETWDAALTKHLLAADPSYIACLNAACGLYFSIESCSRRTRAPSASDPDTPSTSETTSRTRSTSKSKHTADPAKAACPSCTHALCLACNRPWHSGSCNRAARREDKQSVAAIEALGAKPCPKCGVTIEKHGGCDHMACPRCRHNFCWECLGAYTGGTDAHAQGCSHRAPMIALDARNFVAPDATVAQVNRLIEQAARERDRPQGHGHGQGHGHAQHHAHAHAHRIDPEAVAHAAVLARDLLAAEAEGFDPDDDQDQAFHEAVPHFAHGVGVAPGVGGGGGALPPQPRAMDPEALGLFEWVTAFLAGFGAQGV